MRVTRPLRVAVLGLGVMGRQHARILTDLPGVDLVAVCDEAPSAQEWAKTRELGDVFGDWRDVLELRPDAVVNALPTSYHFEVTRALLEDGIDVLVEKPIATDTREARELIALADQQKAILLVGHTERFNPVVGTLRKHVLEGTLGKVISVAARRVGVARPAVPYAGVAIDLAIHDIDVFSYLLGERGDLLFAAGASLDGNVVEDHVDLVLRFGDVIASIQANWITPAKVRRLTVTGTKGVAEVDYLAQTLRLLESAPALIKGHPWDFFAVSRESDAADVEVPRAEPLRLELEHFVECVTRRVEPQIDPEDAAAALSLAISATEAMHATV